MSRRIPEDEYGKRPMGAFRQWMEGSRDPYAGNVEVRAHDMPVESEEQLKKYQEEVFTVLRKAQDTANNNQYTLFRKFYRVAALLCCLTLTLLLFITVAYLPPVGNAGNPANNEVAAKYIEDGMQDTGAVNIVTGMILDYRAFDTFGESNVLFIATCTVLILMRNDKKKGKGSAEEEERRDSFHEPKNDRILQTVAMVLVPFIILFGIYVILNGHLSPGGGFSGGAIIGAGLILYLNAFGFEKTERFFTAKTYKWISFLALSFYCIAKSYSFYTGAHHLESGIPLGTPGDILSSGLILPLNICVGLVVACTMYAFFALFRKGGF